MNTNTVQITLQFKDDGSIAVVDSAKKKIDDLDKSVKGSTGGLSGMSEAWIGLTAKVAIAGAAFYAAKRIIYDTAKEIASAGNDIQRMSRTFNMSTDDFQKWSYVARMADVDIQGFGEGFRFLTRSMSEALQGSGDAAKAFNLLGINLRDTTGKTKDQQTVMMEVIGTLEKYADGVNRDSLMLAIFGRGWLSVKPLIDQGTKAIEENKKEAERFNTILGKDTIGALSESAAAYKKWESVWKVSKIEFWTPMVKTFTDLLETILKLRGALSGKWEWMPDEEGAEKLYQYLKKIGQLPPSGERGKWEEQFKMLEGGPTVAPPWIKEWVAGWTPKPKPEAAGLEDAAKKLKEYYDSQKPYYESLSKQAEQMERGAYGGMEDAGFWQTLKDQKDIQENLKRVEGERAQQLADDMVPAEDKVRAITEKMTEIGEKLRVQLVEMRGLVTDFGWEDYALGLDAANEGTRELTRLIIGNTKNAKQMQEQNKIFQDIGSDIANIWSSNFSQMRRSGEDFSEWFKKLWVDMADYAIGQIAKIALNYAIFGNTKGTYSSGSGLIGLVGSLFGLAEGGQLPGKFIPIKAFQGGGYVDRPTLGLIGEGGEKEWIIPESKMGRRPEDRGGDTTIINNYMYVEATDVDSFERKYGGSITKVIHRNKKSGGMRD